MPSANGVYSLPTGYLAVTGATIQASQHNPPLEDIAAALTLRLSRDGSAPMSGPIQFASGTVTVPGAVFAADATSGFYKTTAGIGVSILGTQVAEFLAGGVSGAFTPGMLFPYTGSTLPSALWVFPYGQTLSRTTYAALWTFAQLEITAGSLLYNNGDGSTTFGIPDLRGRLPVANDGMGGVHANRTTSLTPNGITNGAVGGLELTTLTQGNLPAVTLGGSASGSFSGTGSGTASNGQATNGGGNGAVVPSAAGGVANGSTLAVSVSVSGSFSGGASVPLGGSNAAFTNMPPSIITSYILFAGGQS